jgi:hypothetical protein
VIDVGAQNRVTVQRADGLARPHMSGLTSRRVCHVVSWTSPQNYRVRTRKEYPVAEHTLRPDQIHHKWDNSLPPAIEIEPGDIVHCETAEVTNNQVTPGCDASVLTNLDFDQLYPLAGPIFVKGAGPGDILEVEILRMQTLDWG